MKKLLLLINYTCFSFLITSCQNASKEAKEIPIEMKPIIKNQPLSIDSINISNNIDLMKEIEQGNGVKKDSINKVQNGKAIIHPVPNQSKIDSIKKSKVKK